MDIVSIEDFKPKTFKDRLNIEFKELEDKFIKLHNFINSEDFENNIKDKDMRDLLIEQRDCIGPYYDVLKERLYKLKV